MNIDVLLLDGTFDTGLASVLDAFTIANLLSKGPRFTVRRVGIQPTVTTAQGLSLLVDAVVTRDTPPPDVALVPALGCLEPAALSAALDHPDVATLCGVLSAWQEDTLITAACTGSFVLAEGGLLEGCTATTSWWLAALFRQRYPTVPLDTDRMVIFDGGRVTAGAALGHVDLALWLIRRSSPALARMVARYMLFDSSPSQAAYAMADQIVHSDALVNRFERWVRTHLQDFSMVDAAQAVGASQRTLQRRVQHVLGRTPIAYVQDVRVEQAIHRLQTSDDSLDEIAEGVGYADAVTLRVLLRRKTGRNIRQLRSTTPR